MIAQRTSFAFETTLSSRSLAKLLSSAKTSGYEINLVYLALPDVAIATTRVALRVQQGGHSIPEDVIGRRFYRSLRNLFALYIPLFDKWKLFDNFSATPALIARGTRRKRKIFQEQKWNKLNDLAQKA